ncbi:molybdenum cofactor biosynthesis protein MoaE [Bacteroidota bacterium]
MAEETKYLIEGPIDHSIISERISNYGNNVKAGAHNIFIGQVRDDMIDNKQVKSIIYSSYADMVEKEANLIIKEIIAKYSDVNLVDILHSTGEVKTGENSLFVYVSSGHRIQVFEAIEETVELIKKRFPVWKKEIFEDDSFHWPSNEDKPK